MPFVSLFSLLVLGIHFHEKWIWKVASTFIDRTAISVPAKWRELKNKLERSCPLSSSSGFFVKASSAPLCFQTGLPLKKIAIIRFARWSPVHTQCGSQGLKTRLSVYGFFVVVAFNGIRVVDHHHCRCSEEGIVFYRSDVSSGAVVLTWLSLLN